jgi:hypothetical protein
MDSVEVVIVGNIAFDVNTFLERNDGKQRTFKPEVYKKTITKP